MMINVFAKPNHPFLIQLTGKDITSSCLCFLFMCAFKPLKGSDLYLHFSHSKTFCSVSLALTLFFLISAKLRPIFLISQLSFQVEHPSLPRKFLKLLFALQNRPFSCYFLDQSFLIFFLLVFKVFNFSF